MISDKIHSDFFSSLDILEQFILLDSFSEDSSYHLNLMAHFLNVDEDILINLQNKVKTYLNEIEDIFNQDDVVV